MPDKRGHGEPGLALRIENQSRKPAIGLRPNRRRPWTSARLAADLPASTVQRAPARATSAADTFRRVLIFDVLVRHLFGFDDLRVSVRVELQCEKKSRFRIA
jgi:hypothetical protein